MNPDLNFISGNRNLAFLFSTISLISCNFLRTQCPNQGSTNLFSTQRIYLFWGYNFMPLFHFEKLASWEGNLIWEIKPPRDSKVSTSTSSRSEFCALEMGRGRWKISTPNSSSAVDFFRNKHRPIIWCFLVCRSGI